MQFYLQQKVLQDGTFSSRSLAAVMDVHNNILSPFSDLHALFISSIIVIILALMLMQLPSSVPEVQPIENGSHEVNFIQLCSF